MGVFEKRTGCFTSLSGIRRCQVGGGTWAFSGEGKGCNNIRHDKVPRQQ